MSPWLFDRDQKSHKTIQNDSFQRKYNMLSHAAAPCIGLAPFMQLSTCEMKIVSFKGDHLM